MKTYTIKGIFTADFRKNARTLYDDLRQDKKAWRGELRNGDVYIFVSLTGNQLYFILRDHEITARPGTRYEAQRRMLDYRAWRLENSVFDNMMLQNYANEAGINLAGVKRLEEWYADRVEARRG